MVHPTGPGGGGNDGETDRNDDHTEGRQPGDDLSTDGRTASDDSAGDDEAPGDQGARGPLGRRSYLKLAGAAAAGTALAASGTASASKTVVQKDGYEVWKISGTEVYRLGDGDTLENVLIDVTESGANFYISAPNNPTGWTIRNVGWKGMGTVSDVDGWGGRFQMVVSGNGLIENVFIDNRNANADTEIGGGFVPNHHSGTVEVRNTFIAGCGNNAFYGSNSGKKGGAEGTVEFYNCYHRDNTVSQFRIGTPGSLVQNCVGVVDDPKQTRGTYPNTNSRLARGAWARNMPDNTVRDSVMYVNADDPDAWANYMVDCISKSNSEEAVLQLDGACGNQDAPMLTREVSNSYSARIVGDVSTSNVSVSVIGDGGVPQTPQAAAKGNRSMPPELPGADGSSGGSRRNLDRTLTVDGRGADWTDYSFTVSDDIAKNSDVGTINDTDIVDGTTVAGFVNGGVDGYRFSGDVTAATVDGNATILVDGQAVDPATLGSDTGPAVTTGDATEVAETSVMLNGSLDDLGGANSADVAFQYREPAADSWTAVGAGTLDATGAFSATVSGLSADTEYEYRAVANASDGDSTTGTVVTATTVSSLGRTLTIDGTDAGWTDYEFTVSGEVANNPDVGTFNDTDTAADGTIAGFVNGGVDGYRFSGEITDVTVKGDATVRLDGQEVDPADIVLSNKLVIDGRDTPNEVSYDIAVTGRLAPDPTLGATESGDEVGTSRATGTINNDRDGFRFSGDLTRLLVDGNANITFQDNDG